MSNLCPVYALDDPMAVECYQKAMRALKQAQVPFLVGGAYSFAYYTSIPRHTKDLDLFINPRDRDAALAVLKEAGYRTEVTYSHWLAKAFLGDHFIDLIHSSGNAVAAVDDEWFQHAIDDTLWGERVQLCPAEEMIWSKAFIMERDRFDGADIAHIFRDVGDRLDWRRLLRRFGEDWPVLYSHMILFGYIYPGERRRLPAWVMAELADRSAREFHSPVQDARLCRGTLLSATQYRPDVEQWDYNDGRLPPNGRLSASEAADWTAGIIAGR